MRKIQSSFNLGDIKDLVNQLIDKVNYLEGLRVGAGLELKKSSTGMSISLTGNRVNVASSSKKKEIFDSYKTLSFTQNAKDDDSYDVTLDNTGVIFKVLHEVAFNEDSGTLTLRFREVKSSFIESVSAESEEVIITTVEVCE